MGDGYNLDPEFEKSVVLLTVTNPDFFAKLGFYLEPDVFTDASCRWAVQAAKAIHKETGRGPRNELAVFQRLQSWVDQGKIGVEVLNNLSEVLEDAYEVDPRPSDVSSELTPLLQHFHRHRAVEQLLKSHGRREDLLREAKLIERASRIGKSNISTGLGLGEQANQAIAALRELERYPVGITDLDEGLGGGVPRKSLSLWIGGAGDGKSMALSQTAAAGLLGYLFVVYITLEIPVPYVFARTQAALTGCHIDDFLANETEAMEAMEDMAPDLGLYRVEHMDPGFTTPSDIDEFLERVEQETGSRVDMLCLDYLDRLAAPGKRGAKRNDTSTYATGEIVTTQLRDDIIVPRNLYGHSACQAVRGKAGKARSKGLDDVADSMHKPRIADNVFTLNAQEQAAGEVEMLIRVAKHRTGRSNFSVGPYLAEYGRGLVAPSDLLSGRDSQIWTTLI